MARYFLNNSSAASPYTGNVLTKNIRASSTFSTGSIGASSNVTTSGCIADVDYPSNTSWGATRTFPVTVFVTTANSNITVAARVDRIDNTGATVTTGVFGTAVAMTSTGALALTTGSTNYGTSVASDRFSVVLKYTNTNSMTSQSAAISANDDRSFMDNTTVTEFNNATEDTITANGQYAKDGKTPVAIGAGTGTDGYTTNLYLQSLDKPKNQYENHTHSTEHQPVGTALTNTATETTYAKPLKSSYLPTARRGAVMAYDSVNKRYITCGGYDGTTRFAEVWSLSADGMHSTWNRVLPSTATNAPAGKNLGAAVQLNGANGKSWFIYWGGSSGSDNNDMRILDCTTVGSEAWTNVTQTSAPAVRSYITHHMVAVPTGSNTFDVYLFGGWGAARKNDMQRVSFDLTGAVPTTRTWTQLLADGAGGNPSARSGAFMFYDDTNSRLVMTCGYNGTTYLADSYAYSISGNTWSTLSPSGSVTARELPNGGYDPVNKKLFLFGGWQGAITNDRNDILQNDFSGGVNGAWTTIRANDTTDQSFAPLSSGAACTDLNRRIIVEFGQNGYDGTDKYLYAYDLDNSITTDAPMYGLSVADDYRGGDASAFAFDPDFNVGILSGGFSNIGDESTIANGDHHNEIWAYDYSANTIRYSNAGWLGAVFREGSQAVYDTTGDRILIWGGLVLTSQMTNEVWELKRDTYGNYKARRMETSGTPPAARWLGVAAYDTARNRLVIWGGTDPTALIANTNCYQLDLASGDGTWSSLSPTGTAPPAVWQPGFAYDDTNHILYIISGATNFAGSTFSTRLDKLDLTNATPAWTNVFTTGITGVRGSVLVFDSATPKLIMWGGYNGSVVNNQMYFITTGGTITTVAESGKPSARRSASGWFMNGKFYLTRGRPVSGDWFSDVKEMTPNYGTPNSSTWADKSPQVIIPNSSLVTGATNNTDYHWQSWTTENTIVSSKVSFGGNAESAVDFTIGTSVTTTAQTITGKSRITATTTKTITGKAAIKQTTTQTITGKSRIQYTRTQTLTGVSRVTATTARTITGIARITATTTRTITGKARVTQTVAQTLTGKSRITATTLKTLTGVARVTATTLRTITGKGDVQKTTTQTLTGVARIQYTRTQTLTGKARVTQTIAKTLTGVARIQKTVAQTLTGLARITAVTTRTITGKARVTATTLQTITGKSRITATTTQTITGKARITATTTQTVTGKARVQQIVNKTITGVANLVSGAVTTTKTITGVARISKVVSQTVTGKSRVEVTVNRNFVVDQSNTVNNSSSYVGVPSDQEKVAQSLVFGVQAPLGRIRVILDKIGSPVDTMQMKVYDDNAGIPGTLKDTSTNTFGAADVNGSTQNAFYFAGTFTPTLGATYWIELSRTGSTDGSNYFRFVRDINNNYASGLLKTFNGSTWADAGSMDLYFEEAYQNNPILGRARITATTLKTITGLSRITATTTRTITGKADILATTTKTITGKARIQVTTAKTITGVARITEPATQTITGKSRIQLVVNKTLTGLSRITAQAARTISGVAKITATTTRTITGVARVTATATKTITGKADILKTTARTLTGVSRIQYTRTQTLTGVTRVTQTVLQTITGKARVQQVVNATLTGRSRITITTTRTITGVSNLVAATVRTITGVARITATTTRTITGKARITATTLQTITGKAAIKQTTLRTLTGVSRIQYTRTQTLTGVARITQTTVKNLTGVSRITQSVVKNLTGQSRITAVTVRNLTGVARVTAQATRTITGKGDILKTTLQTITGVARIQYTRTQTLTGKARITETTSQTITGKSRIQLVVNKTITGLSRITAQTTRTITGKARVTATTTQTITGKSRITVTTARTITGVARVTQIVLRTITGVARIQYTRTQTLTGKSRITALATQTLTGKARVTAVVGRTITGVGRMAGQNLQTITGKARITETSSQTITGKARIQQVVNKTLTGLARVTALATRTITGVSRITITTSRTITGVSRITLIVPKTITGQSRITATTNRNITGVSQIFGAVTRNITGVARIQLTVTRSITGVSRIQVTVTRTLTGKARIGLVTSKTLTGVSRIRQTVPRTVTGKARIQKTVTKTITGVSRIILGFDIMPPSPPRILSDNVSGRLGEDDKPRVTKVGDVDKPTGRQSVEEKPRLKI